MKGEATRLNEKYLHFMKTGRPFVHLKLATSLDGKVATKTGDSRWITGVESRDRVQQIRHEYDAILVGAGTAITDDPLLTDRSGESRRKPLTRIVLDENLGISPKSQLVQTAQDVPLIVITGAKPDRSRATLLESKGVEVVRDSKGRDLMHLLDELGSRSIQSLLVEGGAGVAGKFLDSGLVNKVTFFIAPMFIGGQAAPSALTSEGAEKISDAIQLRDIEVQQRGLDVEITGYPTKTLGG
jgi:diaminohydroxyphosphoribosylaminopyrimidine deaminase/5-amino-6-(5-phosphoribosylamino)uracil reductase